MKAILYLFTQIPVHLLFSQTYVTQLAFFLTFISVHVLWFGLLIQPFEITMIL